MTIEIEVSKMDMRAAYDLFNVLLLDEEIGKELKKKHYEKIRFGIDIEFDIYEYFEDNYIVKGKQGIIVIEDEEVDIREFRTEIEKREALIKKVLIENLDEEDITEGRELN